MTSLVLENDEWSLPNVATDSLSSHDDPALIEIQQWEDDSGAVLSEPPRARFECTTERAHWHRSAA
jgi:hypothetical protein